MLADMTYADPPPVRPAEPADLPVLAAIEAEGDRRFDEHFGGVDWSPATPGEDRAARPGFLLVAGTPVVGLAHVLEEGEGAARGAHLELLAVRTASTRQGIGAALVEAACAEAAARGHAELTLTTYADVPWNGPWYRRLGFAEVAEPTGVLAAHLAAEAYLEQHGRRVGMVRQLG